MEKNKKNSNLAEMNEIFNNKTLTYRINGFAEACNMNDLDISSKTMKDGKVFYGYNKVLFNTSKGKKNTDGSKYYIVVNTSDNHHLGDGITISGYYNDLNFSFTNFYKSTQNLDRKILELPFNISLFKTVDNDTYHLIVETIDGMETRFIITKSCEYKDKTISSKVTFYANVIDFSKILKLIKSFIYNPKLLLATYNEVIERKKIVLTDGDLSSGIMQDDDLDKPAGKIMKKIRKIIG